MRRLISIPVMFALTAPVSAAGLTLDLPLGAALSAEASRPGAGFALAVGPFVEGQVATRLVQGDVTKSAWRFPIQGRSTGDLIEMLRQQVRAAGYDLLLDCADQRCGGFDFRFAVDVIGEPAMHVDLGDFRYLSAVKETADGPEFLQLVVSRSPNTGYVELTEIGAPAARDIMATTKAPTATIAPPQYKGELADLLDNGFASLDDLVFETGSANLVDADVPALAELADILKAQPDLTIALVGHTDAVGSLASNISLSRQRAKAVLDRLVSEFGIARERMEAEGIGYLSPVASNLTEDGRAQNRRVEVIITSTR